MKIRVLDQAVYIDMGGNRINIDFNRGIDILTMKELNELERIFATTILEIAPYEARYTEGLCISVTMKKPKSNVWKEYLIND